MSIWIVFLAVLYIISMATGGEEVAHDEQKKEETDKDQEEEKLKTLMGKINPKYKIISKEEYDSLVALKASTPLTV